MNEVNEQKLFFVMIYDVLNTLFKWAVNNVIYTTGMINNLIFGRNQMRNIIQTLYATKKISVSQ